MKSTSNDASVASADWSPEGLRRRLAALPGDDVDRAGVALIAELTHFNSVAPSIRHARTIEVFRSFIDNLVPRLLARIDGIAPPISRGARMHANIVDQLFREITVAYVGLVKTIPGNWFGLGAKPLAHVPLVRAMDFITRRLVLRYRLFSRPPRHAWRTLHDLYSLAERWGLAEIKPPRSRSAPSDIYRNALLLAFAEPSRFPIGDLSKVRDYVARFGDGARLADPDEPASNSAQFLVNPRSDQPGTAATKLHRKNLSAPRFIVDTSRLVDLLQQQLHQLDAGGSPDSLGLPSDADPARYRALLARLASDWSGERRQRATRMRFRPRVEVFLGFPGVWRMLEPPVAFGGNSDGPVGTQRSAGLESTHPNNEWTVVNESPSGFALRHLRGVITALRVGDIIGVRSNDRQESYVCLVRWVRSEGADQLDVGLQQLAPRFAPVTYRRSDGRSITHTPMLYAQSSPQHDRVPIVVAPARLLTAGREFTVNYFGTEIALRADRVLESTLQADLIQVAPR